MSMKLEGYSNYEIYPEEGKIWSYKLNRFVGTTNHKGYWQCVLTNDYGVQKYWQTHRLIWTVVNGTIPEGIQINHIDEDKNNNSINNLNTVTPLENVRWGTCIKRRSEKCFKPILALKNGVPQMYFPSAQKAKSMGFVNSGISRCCYGKNNTYKGYQWTFVDNYLADWWDEEMEKAVF